MSDAVLDFSGLETAAPAASVDSAPAAVETSTPETSTTQTDITTPAEIPAEGADKSPADTTEKSEDVKSSISQPSMKDVHTALQKWKDENPEINGAMAKQIHGTLQRYQALMKEIPGGVVEARETMAVLRELAPEGGDWKQGLEALRGVKAAAEASDAKLYDPAQNAELISDVVADLKAQGKLENLGTLASSLWDAVKENSPQAFVEHQRSLFLATSEETGLTQSLNDVHSALLNGDTKSALAKLKSIGSYFNDLSQMESDQAKEKAIVKRERGALDTQKSAQTTADSAAFNESVGKEARSGDAKSLGAHLAPILKMPFFVGYGKDNLQGLGQAIQAKTWEVCKGDKTYQSKIASLWKAGNRTAILSYHKSFVDSKAKEIVTSTTARMYPSYAGKTATQGKAAAKVAPKVAPKVDPVSHNNQKLPVPVRVAQRPADLDRSKDADGLLQISQRGYRKDGTFVSWRQ